jgi:hypothetical protein
VASAMPWIVETACKLTDVQLPYCPSRTARPTRAPTPTAPVPKPSNPPTKPPTKPKVPTRAAIDPASSCLAVASCATVVSQECGCPTAVAPKTRCLKRAVKRRCCASQARIRTAYYLQVQQSYRTASCGLTS